MRNFYLLAARAIQEKYGNIKNRSIPSIFLIISLLCAGSIAAQPGDYARTLTLSPATPVANFQVKIVLTGAAAHTHMNATGSDLRFYAGDYLTGTQCSYWIEKFDNSGTSIIWVKVPVSATAALTMYYGNTAATTTSNGENTFDWFDGFDGTALSANWIQNNNGGGAVTVGAGEASLSRGTGRVSMYTQYDTTSLSESYVVELKHKASGFYRNRFYLTDNMRSLTGYNPTSLADHYLASADPGSPTGYIRLPGSNNSYVLNKDTSYIMRWDIDRLTGSYSMTHNNYSTNTDFANYSTLPTNPYFKISFLSLSLVEGSNTTIVDWARIRKAGTLPTITIGNEVTVTPLPTITSVPKLAGCQGDTLTINGNFHTFDTRTVRIGATVIPIITQTDAIIKVLFGTVSGNLTVETLGGTSTGTFNINATALPIVDAGTTLPGLCSPGTTGGLGGTVSGGTGIWSVGAIPGATLNTNATFANTTWTAPTNYSGSVVFTLTGTSLTNSCVVTKTKTLVVNKTPQGTVAVSGDKEFCVGESVTFTAPPGYTKYEYLITENAVTTTVDNGANPILTTNTLKAGASVKVRITNNGCMATLDTEVFNVYAIPSGTFSSSDQSGNAPNDKVICRGDVINFSFSTTGMVKYAFILNDTDTLQNTNVSNITNLSNLNNGDKMTVFVTSQGGCSKLFGPITVTVRDTLTTTNLGSDKIGDTICLGSNIFFSASTGFMNYEFFVNGQSKQNGTSPTYTPVPVLENNAEVYVKIKDINGCYQRPALKNVTVHAVPGKPNIKYTEPTSFCQAPGNSITLSVENPEGTNIYQWFRNGSAYGLDVTSQNLTLHSEEGTWTVSLFNENGCQSLPSTPVQVTIYELVAKPNVTASGPLTFCDGDNVVLSSSTGKTYQWYYGTVKTALSPMSGETSQTLTVAGVAQTGFYAVAITNQNDCLAPNKSDTLHVVVNALPSTPTITVTLGTLAHCEGQSVTLSAPVSSSYKWYHDNVEIPGATGQTYTTPTTLASAGSYTVVVSNSNGCFSAPSTGVTVVTNPLPLPTIDNGVICLGSVGDYVTEDSKTDYVWSIVGAGTINSGQGTRAINVTWGNIAGAKSLNVTYTDALGCRSISQAFFANLPALVPTFENGTSVVCVDSTRIYSTQSTGAESDYTWTVSTGTVISGGGSSDHTIEIKWTVPGAQSVSINYTKDGCSAAVPTIYPVTVTPLPVGKFSYAATPYCSNGVNPSPAMIAGAVKGTFSSSAGLVFISPTTGVVNLSASTPGTYKVFNTVAAAGGCGVVKDSAYITITQLPTATIGYTSSPYCNSDNTDKTIDPITGVGAYTGGTFSAPAGLTIDPVTGKINPFNNTPGNYTVTYTIPATDGCPAVVVTTPVAKRVVITQLPVVDLKYAFHTWCKNTIGLKIPNLSGSSGAYTSGTYSVSPASGLSLSGGGNINIGTSTPGEYIITYTAPASAGCSAVSDTFKIIITGVPTATISYPTPSCNSLTTLAVTLNGTYAYEGGEYTAPAQVSINNITGEINPSLSTPGTYTITYTIPATGACATVPVTTSVTISPKAEVYAGTDQNTCVAGGAVAMAGATTNFTSSVLWSGGLGTWTNATSLTGATYTPAATELTTVELKLTATGTNGCALVTSVDTKILTVNALPAPVYIVPETAPSSCLGGIQSFISVKAKVNKFTVGPVASTGGNLSIPDNLTAGVSKTINVSGIPANGVITSVVINFNMPHTANGDLTVNLKAPNTKVLNITNALSGTGGFINTTISSLATNPIQTSGTAPYTGTFAAQMRYGTQGANSVPGNRAFAKSFDELFSNPNGDWVLSVRDGGKNDVGTFNSWTITINYSIPEEPIAVTWRNADNSMPTNLFTDASATIPYTGNALAVVYAKAIDSVDYNYIATSVNTEGCQSTANVQFKVNPSPKVYIRADYCENAGQGKIKLYAEGVNPATVHSYNWSTGETTPSILVDIADEYYVSITNTQSCIGTGVLSVAQELVVNGDFEQGNTGFYTEYVSVVSPNPPGPTTVNTTGLTPEGTYAVDTSANVYHGGFFGRDHTTSEQKGKFMIINGLADSVTNPTYPNKHIRIIWEQTVSVLPNTEYYFSAWAMNFSGSANSVKLQFEVNGVKVGTIADLSKVNRAGNAVNVNIGNWFRFYNGISSGVDDTWNSGEATEAVIRIVNLQPGLIGNDFGLDDISFGTLAPFVSGPDISGRDDQTICVGESILPIVYKVGTGDQPTDGLPASFKKHFDGLFYTISDASTAPPGVYTYLLEATSACPIPPTANGKITILPDSKIVLNSAMPDATLCLNNNLPAPIKYTVSGTRTGAEFIGLPAGLIGVYNTTDSTATISGASTVTGTFNYKVRTQSICKADSLAGVISIDTLPVAGNIISPVVCLNGDGTVKVKDFKGTILEWGSSVDGTNFTPIAGNITDSVKFTNILQNNTYRVKIGNGVCPSVFTEATTVSIQNLWEGKLSSAYNNPFNWAAQNVPTVNTSVCGGIVTIPDVVGTNKDPVLTTTASVNHLNVLAGGNLTISTGGNLQVEGNITNAGIINALNGGIEYTGFTARTIESGIFLNNAIGDLKINNHNYGITLNAPVDVYRSLTFGTGAQKLITQDSLTLKSTKDGTAGLGIIATNQTITGKATVERFINTGKTADGGHGKSWQLLATPTVGQTIKQSWMEGATGIAGQTGGNPHPGYGIILTGRLSNALTEGFDFLTPLGTSIKSWNSATGNYDEQTSTNNPIYEPRGHMVLVRGDRTVFTSAATATPTNLRTKGTLVTGPKSVAIAANSFGQVGNPYASAVAISGIQLSPTVNEFIYVWDPLLSGSYGLGGIVTLSETGTPGVYTATPATGSYKGNITQIQSGQAFFVQTTGAAGTVNFTEASKVSGSAMVMRGGRGAGRTMQLRTNLYGLNADGSAFISDGNLVDFDADFSNEIDGKDARKISNTSENLGIVSNNKLLAIERRQPVTEADTLRYNLSGVRAQNYRFELIATGLAQEGLEGFLEDNYLGTKTPLSLEGSTLVNFNIENKPGSYAADRFRIVFKAALAPLPVTMVEVKAAKKEEGILVQWKVENQNNVKGYEIEKSTDGVNFTKIGEMSAGSTTGYNYVDKGIAAASNYYRIKSVDENGKNEVSMIVKVLVQVTPSDITIYPNPISNGVVNVHLVNQPSGKYRIKMLNPVGQVMIDKKVDHIQGTSVEKIAWDYKMARGMYHLEVTKPDGGIKIIKVMY